MSGAVLLGLRTTLFSKAVNDAVLRADDQMPGAHGRGRHDRRAGLEPPGLSTGFQGQGIENTIRRAEEDAMLHNDG